METFVKRGNQWIAVEGINENSSINDCLKTLGYDHNQFYSYTNFDLPYTYDENDDNIFTVCLKVLTDEIICVLACPRRKSLTDTDVYHYMKDFDFSRAYDYYAMESDLDSAIAEHNYSIDFVAGALGVPYSPDDKILYSSRLKLNFIFEGGYLAGYEIADGYNKEAHDLKNNGSWIFEQIESYAQKYHSSNNDDLIREINIQSKGFYNLPSGVNNEFLPEFANADGSHNYMMLLVAKYKGTEYEQGIDYEDCKCICHNELKFVGNDEDGLDKISKYRYRDYIISFDEKGRFLSCEYSRNSSASQKEFTNNKSTASSGSGCMLSIISLLCFMMMLVAVFIIELS